MAESTKSCYFDKIVTLQLYSYAVLNKEPWLTIDNCQLGDVTDRGKDITMVCDVMAKSMNQNDPLLEPLDTCFLPIPYQLHHGLPLMGASHTMGHFTLKGTSPMYTSSASTFLLGTRKSQVSYRRS